jgi:peroxiredoxin
VLAQGVNTIAVISVNDAFVMAAWQKSFGKESEGIVRY